MSTADELRASGTSPAAIRHHYDISDEFFRLWLDEDLVYSCALWGPTEDESLARAQQRKLDFFATELGVRGANVLDIGCGWGALLDRCVRAHGASGGVGLTLSPAQVSHARARNVPGVTYRLESWVDHQPDAVYDAVSCIEATEHLATADLDPSQKLEVYRSFFERVASWLRPGGRLALQLICLDNVGHEGSRLGRGPVSELIGYDIFPESMPASLSELVTGWETWFSLDRFLDHSDQYRRTFRAWSTAFRDSREEAQSLVDGTTLRTFERYFAAGEACFRLRDHALYRVLLTRRPEPKTWATLPGPAPEPAPEPASPATARGAIPGASVHAVRAHYDLSNDFYALWLGPSMMYSSGMGMAAADFDLERAHQDKIDWFARRLLLPESARVLDVGCGWGATLRRLVEQHGVEHGVGLTLSEQQHAFVAANHANGTDVLLEAWEQHSPTSEYDAIVSFGAFEHFARDGSTSRERVEAYRTFFSSCRDWLAPEGRLGLETIAHDQAPDTAQPLGRGPRGDVVLQLFPESICPQLCEVVMGFEPYFEVEALRSDAADFARTFRSWRLALRAHETEAAGLVGPAMVRTFLRYLASSEAQFRTGALTNYRLVLRRRENVRR